MASDEEQDQQITLLTEGLQQLKASDQQQELQIGELIQAQNALSQKIDGLRELLAGAISTQSLAVSGNATVGGILSAAGEIRGPLAAGSVSGNQLVAGAISTAKIADKAVAAAKIADKAVERKHLTDALAKEAIDDQKSGIASLQQDLKRVSDGQLQCKVVSIVFGASSVVLPMLPATIDLDLGTFGKKVVTIIGVPVDNIGAFQALITAVPVPQGNKAKVRVARSGPIQLRVNFHILFV